MSLDLVLVRLLHAAWLRGIDGGIRADLRRADLRRADLRRADLSGANLSEANLRWANLSEANLRSADLRRADLSEANLLGADLLEANLRSANLSGAYLTRANLSEANLPEIPEGDLTAYKKCRGNKIVTLTIPAAARRSVATGNKHRAEYAIVKDISEGDSAESAHQAGFFYRVGETVRPDAWDENRFNECAGGIHFFMTRAEAEAY